MEGIHECAVAAAVAEEFPGIGLLSCTTKAARSSSSGVVEELEALAQRINGAKAVLIQTEPVAAAYRALRVGLGMEGESGDSSLEGIVRRRLIEGGFRTAGQPIDAITIATLETGVPIQQFAAEPVELVLGVDDQTQAVALIAGEEVLAPIFGPSVGGGVPAKGAAEVRLAAVVAPGVLPEVVSLALDRARSLSAS
jgi:hypothetical protein